MPQYAQHAVAAGFLPQGFSYLWGRPQLLTHFGLDLAIGLSDVAISLALGYLLYRARRDIPFSVSFVAFGLFIVACGMMQFMEVWTLWQPADRVVAAFRVVTAVASIATAAGIPFTVPRVLATIRDARTSEARRVSLAAAIEANQAKSRFMATMSHELRTPLNAIVGYEELLTLELCGPVTADQRAKLERIRQSAEQLMALVNQVLDFERLGAGHDVVATAFTDLGALLRVAGAAFEPQAHRKGLRLIVDAPDASTPVLTDSARVRQILLNLLSNAVKFTNRGEVRLSAQADDRALELCVRDTGIGIKPEHREHIFDPFWQADQQLTRQFGGSGLGLAIVQRLTQLLGGAVTVESTPGHGSTFTVRLPFAPAVPHAAA